MTIGWARSPSGLKRFRHKMPAVQRLFGLPRLALVLVLPAYKFVRKICHTRDCLKKWNREVFGNLQMHIRATTEALDNLQILDGEVMDPEREFLLCKEYIHLQKMEEDLWRQKSRTTWLTTRDLNTKFFHLLTVIR